MEKARSCTPIFVVALILILVQLSCKTGDAAARQRVFQDLYPSPSAVREATQTERVITTTPLPTFTPIVVVYTQTPVPPSVTEEINWLCVVAEEAVYLRPSPNDQNYPIMELVNGTKVKPEGGETGAWIFVKVDDKSGWVNKKYLGGCDG